MTGVKDWFVHLSECKNESTFMGDDIEEIDPRYLYMSSHGYS